MILYDALESAFPGLLGVDLKSRVEHEHNHELDRHRRELQDEIKRALAAWRNGSPFEASAEEADGESMVAGHLSEKRVSGLKPFSRGPRSTDLIANLERMGFHQVNNQRFAHPSGVIVADARRGELTPGSSGGFTFRQRIWGKLSILNPQWMMDQDIPTIVAHIDQIFETDFEPAIVFDFHRPPKDIPHTIAHEGVHFADSLTSAGRLRFATKIANASLNPLWIAESLAYDIFTELRAYAVDVQPGVVSIVDQLQHFFDNSDDDYVERHFPAIIANATAFIAQLFPTVAGHYLDPKSGNPIVVGQEDQQKAGRILADHMRQYGLKSRILIRSEN